MNGFLLGFTLVAGVALAAAVPIRLRRLAAKSHVSRGLALAHVVARALLLLLLYTLL